MKYGLNEQGKFYLEYTACDRPIGTVREEMEAACRELANQGEVLISLSGGLDSQVLLHTFHTMKLPYECAFLYHPGYNEIEYNQVKLLEQKYNFKCIIVSLNPDSHRDQIEQAALETGIPPEHHLMKLFVEQLPEHKDFLQGIEAPVFFHHRNEVYCVDTWNTIAIARDKALNQLNRSGKIVYVDRRAVDNKFALSYLVDPVVDAYLNSFSYTQGNGLVEQDTGKSPEMFLSWEYYVKPIIFGTHWKNELEYFPKFASQRKIDWIFNPVNPQFRHSYKKQRVPIKRNDLIDHLSQWGTNNTKIWTEYENT